MGLAWHKQKCMYEVEESTRGESEMWLNGTTINSSCYNNQYACYIVSYIGSQLNFVVEE